ITPIFFQNKIEDDFNPSVDISDRARWLRRRKQSNTRQGIKEFARMQRWEVFEKIFGSKGEHLKAEVERYFSGMSHRNFRGEGKATGDALFQVIAHGALGATDALLINFANNDPGIHGFVTCDRDFLHLENFSSIRKDLVIYLPDSLIEGQKRRAA
ncbi:MAG: hypothetical protein N2578_05005, partial [Bdellovibrionaceae bacterium]|nr:hypothetical protein [Pseudobdellovibrionaceae bacterium]